LKTKSKDFATEVTEHTEVSSCACGAVKNKTLLCVLCALCGKLFLKLLAYDMFLKYGGIFKAFTKAYLYRNVELL